MDALLIVVGILWIIYQLVKEANTKQVPKDSDFRQAQIDYYSGKYSIKEVDKRLKNGYYVKKDK